MFVRFSTYLEEVRKHAETLGENLTLRVQVSEYRTTLDWMRTRVNQLEKERALLFREVTKLNIPTVEIAPATMTPAIPASMQLPNFEDLGDDAATKLGIGHDANGELLYDEQ